MIEIFKYLWNPETDYLLLTPLKSIIEILDKYSKIQFNYLFSKHWRAEAKYALNSLITQTYSIRDIHRKEEKTSQISKCSK